MVTPFPENLVEIKPFPINVFMEVHIQVKPPLRQCLLNDLHFLRRVFRPESSIQVYTVHIFPSAYFISCRIGAGEEGELIFPLPFSDITVLIRPFNKAQQGLHAGGFISMDACREDDPPVTRTIGKPIKRMSAIQPADYGWLDIRNIIKPFY